MYAVVSDLDKGWGVPLIDVLTIDERTKLRDGDKITSALESASATIDSYCSRRFPLPLAPAPSGVIMLRNICVDLAVGTLATSADRMTEIIQRRYDQALTFLRDVAAGKADIELQPKPGAGAEADVSPNEAVLIGNERVFSRDRLRDL